MIRAAQPLLGSMAIQALGAAATLGIGIVVAVWQGPESQGHYGLVRSTADLLLALALFGLPQSLVHAINQQHVRPAMLLRWAQRYVVALLALALASTLLAEATGGAWMPSWLASPWMWCALLVGSVGWVLQGMLRVFVLCRGSSIQFAWVSVMPALTLAVVVCAAVAAGRSDFELALLASGVTSALLAMWQLGAVVHRADWHAGGLPQWRPLLAGGLHAFAQTLALALQPWASLHLIAWQGASPAAIGHFVFAAYVYQVFALPVSFVAPLLFARISRASGQGQAFPIGARLRPALAWTVAGAVFAALVLPLAVPALLGPAYAPSTWACVWMALCGPALLLNRLGVAVLLGRGQLRATTAHALWRALALPLAMLLCWAVHWADTVTMAAFAWLLVEVSCVGVLWLFWSKARAMPRGAGVP
jgi:O-antigen/teichoic acid export membrane protein